MDITDHLRHPEASLLAVRRHSVANRQVKATHQSGEPIPVRAKTFFAAKVFHRIRAKYLHAKKPFAVMPVSPEIQLATAHAFREMSRNARDGDARRWAVVTRHGAARWCRPGRR
jgi:hypothetical protein